jgi:hypothetical protein
VNVIDLVLLFLVLTKGIYPLAKAKGKSPASWMLFTCVTWMFVEFSILAIDTNVVVGFYFSRN